MPALGTISLTGSPNPAAGDFITAADISAGKIIFTPVVNANGSPYTTFTFQVEDDGATGGANVNLDPVANTMTINVSPVNTPPTGADNTIALNEDDVRVFLAADFGFSDAGDAPSPNNFLAVKIASLPLAGTLRLSGTPVTLNQFIPVADFAAFTFTPAANASGTPYTSFTFQVQDDGGSLAGSDLDPIANTITFNVAPLNDAPVGASNTINATEDLPYTFSAIDFGFSDPNDSPANNFSGVVITTVPTLGVLKDGAIVITAGYFVPAINFGTFTYVPQPPNANGTPYTSFTFKVQDDGSGVAPNVNLDQTARTMTINVQSANDAPTDLILTVTSPDTQDGANNVFIAASTVASGTTIGTLTATDTNDVPPNNFTFTVQGGADASKFTVSGTTFKANAVLDGGVQATYNVILRVTDDGIPNLFLDEAFVINLNRAPTDIQVSANNAAENGTPPTTIGTLTATDPDPSPAFTFSLAVAQLTGCGLGNDADNASFTILSPATPPTTLSATASFNYEATAAHTARVCVQVADQFGSTYQKAITVNITDVNEPPVLDAAPTGPFSIPENSTANTNVSGALITFTDPESGPNHVVPAQTYTYSIDAAGNGPGGNAFQIDSTGQIKVLTPSQLDYEVTPSFTLTVRVTDVGAPLPNLSGTRTVTINLTDVNEAPVAVAASHNVAGNINISTAAGNLFTSATDPDAADNTVSFAVHHTASAVNNLSGRLVVNTDGSYTYNPPVGVFTGSEIGTFKICDDGGDNTPPGAQLCSADTNITFNLSEGIWFVNSGSSCVSACDGRFTNPFTSIASLQAVNGDGAANHPKDGNSIFIYENVSEYSGPLTLRAGQKLFGQDATTTLSALTGVTPPADSSTLPTLNSANGTFVKINSSGTTLTLNNTAGNNTLRGFTLTNATTMALSGTGFGALTISEVSVANGLTGGAISLTTGTLAAAATIDSLAAAPGGANNGVLLSGISSGSLTVNGSGTINASSSGAAVSVVGGVVGLTYGSGAVVNQGGSGPVISVSGAHTTGTLQFNGNVTATAGSGFQFDNADGTYTFNGASNTLSGVSLTAGVNIVNASAGTFTFSSGTSISNPTGTAFNASSSSANVTYNGTISKSSAGAGVNLATNAGTVSFTGALTLSTSTGSAFSASGGGTVTSTNTTSTLTTTTGTALNVSSTTIGAAGLTFRSINSNGAASGIILNTTGALGGLTVTGNSSGLCGGQVVNAAVGTLNTVTPPVTADCTGGTIQNSTGVGIVLNSTKNVSLTRMFVTNSGTDGITINNINGFTLANSNIGDASGVAQDRGIELGDFSTGTTVNGAISITNSAFTQTPHDNFGAGIGSGTSTWTLTGNQFSNNGNSGFNVELRGTAVATMTVTGNRFQGSSTSAEGVHMQPAGAGTTGTLTANVSSNSFSDMNIAIDVNCDISAQCNYTASSNTIINVTRRTIAGGGFTSSHAINVFQATTSLAGSLLNYRMENNVIGSNALPGSGSSIGNCVRINFNGNGQGRVLLNNNTMRECPIGRGLEITGRNGTGRLDVTLTNNNINHINLAFDVANASNFPLGAIVVLSNTVPTTGYNVKTDIRGNTVPAAGGSIPAASEITGTYLSVQELPNGAGTSIMEVVDNGAVSATPTAELQSQNTGDAGANTGVTLIAGPILTPP